MKPTNNTSRKYPRTYVKNDDKKKIIDFMLKEYDQLFIENRNIIEKRIGIYKILTSAMIAIIGYVLAGLIFYINSRGITSVPIPQSLAYGYSFLGIILTLAVYTFVHNAYFYIGPSKKHTIRNWRAIHSIRAAFKSIDKELGDYIILPDIINHADRPRLSSRWELGAFIYPIYHLIFYIIISLLLIPLFSQCDTQLGLKININNLDAFTSALLLILPFIIYKLVIGGKPMRDYIANIIEARKIGLEESIFPSARNSKATKTPAWLWYLNIFLVLFSLAVWLDHFIINYFQVYHNSYFSIRFIIITIILSLMGEITYLFIVGVLGISITKNEGVIRINISRIGKN